MPDAFDWRLFRRDFALPAILFACLPLPFAAALQWAGGTAADGVRAALGWCVMALCYWLPLAVFLYRWRGGWVSRLLLGYLISLPLYLLALVFAYLGFGSSFSPGTARTWGIYLSSTPTFYLLVVALFLIVRRGGASARVARAVALGGFGSAVIAPVGYALTVDRYTWPETARVPAILANARVVDVEHGRVIDGMNIHLDSGRVVAVVPAAADSWMADSVDVLDVAGAYVVPGLIDVHTHLQVPIRDAFAGFSLAYFVESLFSSYADHRRQYLEHGVTTVRDLGGPAKPAFALRRAIQARELLGPRLFVVGRLVTSPNGHPVGTIWPEGIARTSAIQATDGAMLRAELQRDFDAGPPDAVKLIYGTINRAPTRLAPELLRDGVAWAIDHRLPAVVHAETAEEVAAAAEVATGIEHAASIEELSPPLLERLAKRRPFVSPTFGELKAVFRLRRMDPTVADSVLAQRREYILRMHEAGVPIVAGTDAPLVGYGAGLLEELDELSRAGLSNAAVLRAATVNNAAYLGVAGKLGQVREGHFADLLVLQRNPLEDLRALRAPRLVLRDGVVVAGGGQE